MPASTQASENGNSRITGTSTSRAAEATAALMAVLNGTAEHDKILLRAAAGAGKSYALVHMVGEALANPNCLRVAVTAFANKQVIPLARRLGAAYGLEQVCPFVSDKWRTQLPDGIEDDVAVVAVRRASLS